MALILLHVGLAIAWVGGTCTAGDEGYSGAGGLTAWINQGSQAEGEQTEGRRVEEPGPSTTSEGEAKGAEREVEEFGALPPLVTSHAGVLAVLCALCSIFFYLEKGLGLGLFKYVPPLMFIYLVPVILSNTNVIPTSSAVYESIRAIVLPMMLVLLLIKVDIGSAIRVMGKGVLVMLIGTLGIVLGAPLAYFIVRGSLEPDAWRAFGTLAGSWIGGTGNMAAVAEMIDVDDQGPNYGLAILGDTVVYIIWLPILLVSKNFADWFSKFASVSGDRISKMEKAAEKAQAREEPPQFFHHLYLLSIALIVTWVANILASVLPEVDPYINAGTWKILIVTTVGIGLSFTPAKGIPGSQQLALALVYIFVARMGASAKLEGIVNQAIPFLVGAFIWIFFHGILCVMAAKLFRVDVHTLAIASAANVGGAASAPVVAAHHNEKLVPASILMAMIGYSIGNYAAYIAALLCQLVSTI